MGSPSTYSAPAAAPKQVWSATNPGPRQRAPKRDFSRFEEPKDLRVMLKIKIKTLELEAKLIRRKEHGHPSYHPVRLSLAQHRKTTVRHASRSAQLALAFLRSGGGPESKRNSYRDIEPRVHPHNRPDWAQVQRLVRDYGERYNPELSPQANREIKQAEEAAFKQWIADADQSLIYSAGLAAAA
jgi:hypothetical protein